jgi:hypothetical protein
MKAFLGEADCGDTLQAIRETSEGPRCENGDAGVADVESIKIRARHLLRGGEIHRHDWIRVL